MKSKLHRIQSRIKSTALLLSARARHVLRIASGPLQLLRQSRLWSLSVPVTWSLCSSFTVSMMRLLIAQRNSTFVYMYMLILIGLTPVMAMAQVPVALGPEPKAQFFDTTGVPLASGIVCTYAAGTSTPQATYTDSTGMVQNANPIVLDSAGRANIWWIGSAYKVVLAGGGTCASPSNLQWTVDGFSIGVFAAANNTFSGNNTFNGTSTFNGPVNIVNGGSLNGTFTGNPNFSGTVTFSGSLSVSQLTLTVATGTPPLVVTSTTVVPNLNVEIINGVAYPASPSLHSVPVITATNTATYKVIPDCNTANHFIDFTQSTNAFSCATTTAVVANVITRTTIVGTVVTVNGDNTVLTKVFTLPATGGPYHLLVSYSMFFVSGGSDSLMASWVTDGTDHWAVDLIDYPSTKAEGMTSSEISPSTYAAGAMVTLNLIANDAASGSTIGTSFLGTFPTVLTVSVVPVNVN